MRRSTFHVLAFFVWVGLIAASVVYYNEIVDWSESLFPDLGSRAFLATAACAIIIGLFFHKALADWFAPKIPPSERELTDAQKRERARREAELAIRQGRKGSAMLIYEQAGMYVEAIAIAEELKDKPGLARLSVRIGHYKRARRLYLDLKDYEAAAHTSVLMGEVDTAREYYRQAAEACSGKVPDAQEAVLWDRAGDSATAAALYEQGADLERAAECYSLLGDRRNAVRCEEHAKLLKVLEQKQREERGERVPYEEQKAQMEKATAARQAKEMETIGDLLGAGFLYRKAEKTLEAAMVFERFEEWERSARAYEQAGQADRAELVRMHIEAREVIEDEISARQALDAQKAPEPTAMPSVEFVPISRAMAVPVYLGVGGAPPTSPLARLEVCRRVRRGNFLEAAEFAKAAGDWVMTAAYYEHAGRFLAAADVYRQIGDINAAAWCLEKAGRCRDAAFMILGIGQNARAVEWLLKAIERGDEVEDNALALGELLMQLGKCPHALALLETKIAAGPINENNADLYFQFAKRFEDRKAWNEAYAVYDRLLAAGAQSEELNERKARVEGRLAVAPEPGAQAPTGRLELDEIDSMMNVALQEFADELETRKAAAAGPAPTHTLQFPVGVEPPSVAGAKEAATGDTGTMLFAPQELSLFGRAVGDPKLAAGEKGAFPEPGDDSVDPFAPRRRYEIKSELGRGGMGVVYETVDTVLGRRVALKVILNEAAESEGFDQLLVEARAIALLSHPNVVIIYDVGLMGLQHYIAMEFVSGGSLADLVKEHQAMPLKEALRLFTEMCRGVQVAHENGIVHRDIKPANILLTERKEVKIADFGLAKVRRGHVEPEAREGMPLVSGTPGFMAPEQIHGAGLHPGFDVYSLGITLFTMLVGQPPHAVAHKTSLLDILAFQESGDVVPMRRYRPNAPEPIEQIYQYCVAADPKKRYQSIGAFLPTIEQIYSTLKQ